MCAASTARAIKSTSTRIRFPTHWHITNCQTRSMMYFTLTLSWHYARSNEKKRIKIKKIKKNKEKKNDRRNCEIMKLLRVSLVGAIELLLTPLTGMATFYSQWVLSHSAGQSLELLSVKASRSRATRSFKSIVVIFLFLRFAFLLSLFCRPVWLASGVQCSGSW